MSKRLLRENIFAWGSFILFIKKPDDSWRICVDYRHVNARIRKNAYPLPLIQKCIDQLNKARYLSRIDLINEYWQIRIKESDIPKTTFNTRNDKYEFLIMSFDLINASTTFQIFINKIFRSFLNKFVIAYLDDIVIYSNFCQEHIQYLRQVLDLLQENQLYAKFHKCMFDKSELNFCEHVVGNDVVRMMNSKIKSIRE